MPSVGLASLFLTLTYFTSCSSATVVNFEQVNTGWEKDSETPTQTNLKHTNNTMIEVSYVFGKTPFYFSLKKDYIHQISGADSAADTSYCISSNKCPRRLANFKTIR